MLTKPNFLKSIGLLFLGGVFGFYTSSYSFFKFNSEINLIDFATLVISTIVGIYIAVAVQKSQSIQKSEKDLVTGEINQIKSEMRLIYNSVSQNQINFSETVFRFKVISGNLSDLTPLFNICNIVDDGKLQDVLSKLTAIKRLVTSTSPAPGTNQIILSQQHQNAFLTLHSDFNISLLKLIIHVNKG